MWLLFTFSHNRGRLIPSSCGPPEVVTLADVALPGTRRPGPLPRLANTGNLMMFKCDSGKLNFSGRTSQEAKLPCINLSLEILGRSSPPKKVCCEVYEKDVWPGTFGL